MRHPLIVALTLTPTLSNPLPSERRPMTFRSFPVFVFAAALSLGAAGQAAAPTITATGAWARPTPPGATTGAVYVTLTNRGKLGDSLVSATSPSAAKVEFHSMSMAGGVMRMTAITAATPVAPGAALRFAPGAGHVMLIGLKAPLKAGGRIRVVFTFAKAGAVSIDVPVRDAAPAADPMAGMKM